MVGDKIEKRKPSIIVFITDQPVPIGLAATNRLLSLSRGVYENKVNVQILILNPTENYRNINNTKIKGNYKGIFYKYLAKDTVIPKNYFLKIISFIRGLINLGPELIKLNKNNKIEGIIMLHTKSIYPILVYIIAKIYNIPLVQERNEFPFIGTRKGLLNKIDYFIYRHFTLKLFDGFFLITNNLVNHFKKIVHTKAKFCHLPMTVEYDRFDISINKSERKYIAYCGYMWGDKDGVPILVEAFSRISNNHPDINLYLIGDISNKKEFEKMKAQLKLLGIEEKIIFTGRVEQNKMPELLKNAEILALARPSNIQAKGGFPTKLGEYLATANPVVVTRVGEIPKYLKDGENAYIAEPDSVESFSKKLDEALSNKEVSKKIGKKGRETCLQNFNYYLQGKKIIKFINSLKN